MITLYIMYKVIKVYDCIMQVSSDSDYLEYKNWDWKKISVNVGGNLVSEINKRFQIDLVNWNIDIEVKMLMLLRFSGGRETCYICHVWRLL